MPLRDYYLRVGEENVPLSRCEGIWHNPKDPEPHIWVLLSNPIGQRRIAGDEASQAFVSELQMVRDAWDAEQRVSEGWVNVWGEDD